MVKKKTRVFTRVHKKVVSYVALLIIKSKTLPRITLHLYLRFTHNIGHYYLIFS